MQDRRKQLLENALETNCSKNAFQDLNPQFNKLLNYSYKLAEELHVDSLIKRFIIDLILYTNINEFGLQELYKGAFIIIRDGGFFYKRYKCIFVALSTSR